MSGTIALVGAGEFLEGMAEVDSYLLAHVPEQPARVAILPTAAGLEDPRAWTDMGVPHFQRLGAQAEPVFVRDQKDANDPAMAEAVRKSNFVYLSGGSPGYLLQSLQGSEVWAAIQEVYAKGGVLAGCSAGAMVLGGQTRVARAGARSGPPAPQDWGMAPGLGLVPQVVVSPHFNRMTEERLEYLLAQVPEDLLILGVDEHTAAVGDGSHWTVMGRGSVFFSDHKTSTRYLPGQQFSL